MNSFRWEISAIMLLMRSKASSPLFGSRLFYHAFELDADRQSYSGGGITQIRQDVAEMPSVQLEDGLWHLRAPATDRGGHGLRRDMSPIFQLACPRQGMSRRFRRCVDIQPAEQPPQHLAAFGNQIFVFDDRSVWRARVISQQRHIALPVIQHDVFVRFGKLFREGFHAALFVEGPRRYENVPGVAQQRDDVQVRKALHRAWDIRVRQAFFREVAGRRLSLLFGDFRVDALDAGFGRVALFRQRAIEQFLVAIETPALRFQNA